MTTVVWDGKKRKVMSGDTRLTGNMILRVYDDESLDTKIFTPDTPVIYESSPIIAVGTAGHGPLVDSWKDFLFAAPRTIASLKSLVLSTTTSTPATQSLLILTTEKCWQVDWKAGFFSSTCVTDESAAIGSGASFASRRVERFGGIVAIIRAARCDHEQATNTRITQVQQHLDAKWRSVEPSELLKAKIVEMFLHCVGVRR
ncbi:hypothetical protein KDX30_01200 [Pseudomonas sp. CDFA 553]|uniref:hypothetical protein n=1 Tax=Pseudomonas quasicaspiana TaxID=2829821 RepID=UPI001E5A7F29|nr:hypothetical protein [Pseudomonas quasicaspiana]MCD5986507.1 hypothetical protein [Pseudomonas quasicaspiana]